jgi:peroxiredoxin
MADAEQHIAQVGDAAPDCTLLDDTGQETTLASFWQNGDLVVLFLRHFNCPHCREQVRMFQATDALLAARGLRLVLVGLGTPERAATFRREMQVAGTLLCDPDKASYRAYHLLRLNPFREIRVSTVRRYVAALAATRAPGVSLGQDMVQLGGTFGIASTGIVRYAYRAERISDNPTPETVLNALACVVS